jgi:hypothetical protein
LRTRQRNSPDTKQGHAALATVGDGGRRMIDKTPPIRAKFLFWHDTWVTIGWAKRSSDGDYVWCRQDEATHVIGESAHPSTPRPIVAPIADTGRASKTKSWEYDRPDTLLASSFSEADKNVGRRFRIFEERLQFL